ncbi:MAG: glycosyltransferase family 9 protein [Bacteroidota bacterium]|nr:glycosyltransferase family 9 protein [Bacteroidota bacterium]
MSYLTFKKMKMLFASTAEVLAYFLAPLKKTQSTEKQLLIVRLDAIGDYILFRNFLVYIKQSEKYKSHKITIVGNNAWKNIAEAFDNQVVDNWIWVQVPKVYFDFDYRFKILQFIYAHTFDTAVMPMHTRLFMIDKIFKYLKCKKIAHISALDTNYNLTKLNLANEWFDQIVDTGKETIFEFERNKLFFEKWLEIKIPINKPELNTNEIDSNIVLSKFNIINTKYIVVFPGGSSMEKRWKPKFFSNVINYISDIYEYKILLIGAPNEIEISKEILSICKSESIIDLVGKTTLVDLVYLIKNANLLIANESSGVHVAVATETPAVCISYSSFYGRFTPYPPSIPHKIKYVFHPKIESKDDSFTNYNHLSINDINPTTINHLLSEMLN